MPRHAVMIALRIRPRAGFQSCHAYR
jgi:hypothetical protein